MEQTRRKALLACMQRAGRKTRRNWMYQTLHCQQHKRKKKKKKKKKKTKKKKKKKKKRKTSTQKNLPIKKGGK